MMHSGRCSVDMLRDRLIVFLDTLTTHTTVRIRVIFEQVTRSLTNVPLSTYSAIHRIGQHIVS
jgi:hypothetical protein